MGDKEAGAYQHASLTCLCCGKHDFLEIEVAWDWGTHSILLRWALAGTCGRPKRGQGQRPIPQIWISGSCCSQALGKAFQALPGGGRGEQAANGAVGRQWPQATHTARLIARRTPRYSWIVTELMCKSCK